MLNLLREIQTIVMEKKEYQKTHQDQQSRIGLVFYSLSEIILCLGERWTIRWLRQLEQIISPPIDSPLYGPKVEPFVSIVFLLNTSLHFSTFVSEIQVSILFTSLHFFHNFNN